ncbi:MAG: hypothetical protein JNL39_06095 [Opitutaceae bacterium]|nr:hypothetical protein [Opitutaceae bacterium]
MTAPPLTPTTTALLAHYGAFKAFIAARVGNEADAEDLLQHGLAKAFRHAGELKTARKSSRGFIGCCATPSSITPAAEPPRAAATRHGPRKPPRSRPRSPRPSASFAGVSSRCSPR